MGLRHFDGADDLLGLVADVASASQSLGKHGKRLRNTRSTTGALRQVHNIGDDLRDLGRTASKIKTSFSDRPAIAERVGLRTEIRSVDVIDEAVAMNPSQFEQVVATALNDYGYAGVRRIGGSGDRGIDVQATIPDSGLQLVTQVKRYQSSHRVNSTEMQRFVGAMHIADATHGLFVTTSSYTDEAKSIADKVGITLVDGHGLASFIDGTNGAVRELLTAI